MAAGHDPEKAAFRSSGERTSPSVLDPELKAEKGYDEHASALHKLDSEVVTAKLDPDEALKHLPASEREIIKRQIDTPEIKITYFTVFRYAKGTDFLIMLISTLCAIAGGAALPLMTVPPPLRGMGSIRPDPSSHIIDRLWSIERDLSGLLPRSERR